MTITETTRIDIVATRPDSPIVKLVIADHLDWADHDTHADELRKKLDTYLTFVPSGQLGRLKSPPIPASPDIRIVLVLLHEPTAAAMALFEELRASLALHGLALDVEMGPREVPAGSAE